ncbi:hypothetical protein J5751_06395 [bacterium]|nr:hypothetical protein [bacterium]
MTILIDYALSSDILCNLYKLYTNIDIIIINNIFSIGQTLTFCALSTIIVVQSAHIACT